MTLAKNWRKGLAKARRQRQVLRHTKRVLKSLQLARTRERRGEEDEKMRRRRLKKLDDEYGLCVAGADLMIRARMCVCAVLNLRKGRSWWWQEEEMPKGDWCPELLELVLLELE